jgi:hypothetical protein
MERKGKKKGSRSLGPVVSKTVSLPVEKVNRVLKFSEETGRSFSNAVSFLVGEGLYYEHKVKLDLEAEIRRRVEKRLSERRP